MKNKKILRERVVKRVFESKKISLKNRTKEQLQSNQGFSLMEMLLCLALSAIVISAIGGFMVTSVRQYNSVDREIELQTKSQTVLNQITRMAKEADNIAFKIIDGKSYAIMYYKVDEAMKNTSDIANAETKIVQFQPGASDKPGTVYLFETKYGEAAKYRDILNGKAGKGDLMASYVSAFKVTGKENYDLNSGLPESQNSVDISLEFKSVFKKDIKTYKAADTVKLRNKVVSLVAPTETPTTP